MPNWPTTFHPQHFTLPSVVSAQVCRSPAPSAWMLVLIPLTLTGVRRFTMVPSPTWPELFCPQHLTAFAAKAHE